MPDLRIADDAFLANDEDWTLAQQLDEVFDRLDFRGLLARHLDLGSPRPAVAKARHQAHILNASPRARQWLEALGPLPERAAILDLGCGSGSFLASVAPRRPSWRFWGLDIALRWLIVARKRLDDLGLASLGLVCGCAERLPFPDRVFHAVVAGDVIEHVADRPATLAEAYRVLRPGGRLFLASPNRYSLTPEPHVQVWGVGFLPRRWMASYVRWARNAEYRAIHNLGYREWRRLLRSSPFGGGRIVAPRLTEGDLAAFPPPKRLLARGYNRCVAWGLGQRVALGIGPLFHVVCTRTDPADRSDAPATPPGSRPSGAPARGDSLPGTVSGARACPES